MRRLGVAMLVAIALGVAGCGVDDPYSDSERPGEQASGAQASGGQPRAADARAVLRRTSLAMGNWTSTTVDGAYRRALEATVGDARGALTRQSSEIRAGVRDAPTRLSSRAEVETVALEGRANRREALVVTKESVSGPDIPGEGEQYKVTLATVEYVDRRWVISSWRPQP